MSQHNRHQTSRAVVCYRLSDDKYKILCKSPVDGIFYFYGVGGKFLSPFAEENADGVTLKVEVGVKPKETAEKVFHRGGVGGGPSDRRGNGGHVSCRLKIRIPRDW